MTLRADPEKVRQWQQRSRKRIATKLRLKSRNGMKRSSKRIGAGRRMNEWSKVWAFLKPRLEAAGRTACEFDWPEVAHECWGPIDPAHSKKRREMQGDDIYAVAISCREFHKYLDECCTHERMEQLVLEAINRHGGLILPAQKGNQ